MTTQGPVVSEIDGAAMVRLLRVLRRRKFLVIQALIIMPLVAFVASSLQPSTYEASAEVLLSTENLAQAITGTGSDIFTDPKRNVATQAKLAAVPEVAGRTRTALGLTDRTVADLTHQTTIAGDPDANLLTITVDDMDSTLASRIATEYARQFIRYRQELDTAAVDAALSEVRASIRGISNPDSQSTLYSRLLESEQQLQTLRSLQTSNAFLVRGATEAEKTGPRPVRNAILAFVLAVVVGVSLAFAAESLDTRLRSADDIDAVLGHRMLGRIPLFSRSLSGSDEIAMFTDSVGRSAEAYRLLATNLEFVLAQDATRTLLVTSAIDQEGKSTTASNLAVALARSGKRVLLVDMDMRRPRLHRIFGTRFVIPDHLVGHPGITDALLGRNDIEDSIVWIDPRADDGGPAARSGSDGNNQHHLGLVLGGASRLDPGEVVASAALRTLLARLAVQCDVMIVDAPPLLRSGDALALASHIEALLLVSRVDRVRRPMLREVKRLLSHSPARMVGFVATGEPGGDAYGGYYGYEGKRENTVRTPTAS